jgi:hypothetical protein
MKRAYDERRGFALGRDGRRLHETLVCRCQRRVHALQLLGSPMNTLCGCGMLRNELGMISPTVWARAEWLRT